MEVLFLKSAVSDLTCYFFRVGWFVVQARERESPTTNKNNNKSNASALKVTANPAEIADELLRSGGCAAHG